VCTIVDVVSILMTRVAEVSEIVFVRLFASSSLSLVLDVERRREKCLFWRRRVNVNMKPIFSLVEVLLGRWGLEVMI
jgi:hypothetical protein